jgi:hypothetical protein
MACQEAGIHERFLRRRDARASYVEAQFRPYTIAVGQVAMAANDLADKLSGLFCSAT